MARKKEVTEEAAEKEISIWLGDAQQNLEDAVAQFTMQWEPAPKFALDVEVMDISQLRAAMGCRASGDYGDPWPTVERLLLDQGFRWRTIGFQRVMLLRERGGYVPDTGWEEAREIVTTN